MKKAFLFYWGLIVAFASLFVSCSEENSDKDNLICKITVSCTEGGSVKITNYIGTTTKVLIGNSVEVVAVTDDGYKFIGWYVGSCNESVSTETVFTFIASEDIALLAKFEKIETSYHNGYEFADLGLPSGIKWAICNVGATKPEEYGGYYAWGETEEKEYYDWSTYKWCKGSNDTMTKYCTNSSYGTIDNKRVLDPEDDVAHVKWGGNWRMPTYAEQDELRRKCTWEWTTLNGVNGYKLTGPNGNSIFLPASGYYYGIDVYNSGYYGFYWSSSLYGGDAYGFGFDNNLYGWNNYDRYNGLSVRPVCK